MAIEIKMPRMSDTMEVGTLVKWNVAEGDAIEAGQALADIETDKATMEMPAYDEGIVAKIVRPEGSNVSVGETLMIVAEEGESVEEAITSIGAAGTPQEAAKDATDDAKSVARSTTDAQSENSTSAAAVTPDTGANGTGARLLVSPLARRIAEEHGLDLNTIRGSGPHGRIVKRDVVDAVEGKSPKGGKPSVAATRVDDSGSALATAPPVPSVGDLGGRIEMSNVRQTIARRLVESKTTIPHYQVTAVIDADALVTLRETLNEQLASQGVKLSVNDFLVRACALAIHQHPMFNAVWGGDHVDVADRVNIGMAVSIPEERGGGLVVATIYDADRKGLRQIAMESKALAMKARTRGLTIEEMSNSTFTISNLGMFGTDNFTAIINPPNVAILAVGAAIKKPVVRNDELTIGYEMNCTLSCDHRIIDGATGAQYLVTLRNMLENPATLLV